MGIFRVLLLIGAGMLTAFGGAAPSTRGTGHLEVVRQAALRLGHEPTGQVLGWLRRQPGVTAVLGRDGRTIDLHFADGQRAEVLPRQLSLVRVSASVLRPQQRLAVGTARAAVLEPFATELGLGPTAGDPEVSALQQAGFSVTQFYDTQVTLAALQSLPSYNVIYMHTHSGLTQAGGGVVASGELVSAQDPAAQALLQDGSVIEVGVSGSQDIYYGVTARFVTQHMGRFPASSLMFLNGCSLLQAPDFWQALQSKGVGVMVSWNHEATSRDNYLGAAAFFNLMNQGMTVANAIKTEVAAGYGKSVVDNANATLGYDGDGSITLAAAGATHSASATPTPASHPVVPTATTTPATPRPTATVAPTRTATPTVSLTLRHKVAAGKMQRITVRTVAGRRVHVVVIFPNGRHRSFRGVAGADGAIHFRFKQHRSLVRYHRNVAHVKVQIGNDTAVTTGKYRIGYSVDDVSLVPRKQAAGKPVTIYVHSTRGAAVRVVVVLPNGHTTSLDGTTNRKGWAIFRYHLPARAGQKRSHKGTVTAYVQSQGRGYQQSTTFIVR